MVENIGEIFSSSGELMLKMWRVHVPEGHRPLQKHSHIQFEITSVTSGSGEYTVGGHIYPMNKGDLFVFSSNEFHSITNIGKSGLEIVNIHFEPRYLWGNSFDSMTNEHLSLCFSHSPDFSNRISAEKSQPLTNIFNLIVSELTNKNSEYGLMVKSLLNQLLVMLVRNYNYSDSTISVSRSHIQSVRKAITYIDTHIAEKLTLNDISKVAGISPTYFSALFKKISNITVWNYIFSKRIEKALHLISENNASETMLEIALQCGFNNTANFNKIFRKQTNMTPSEYEKLDIKNIT